MGALSYFWPQGQFQWDSNKISPKRFLSLLLFYFLRLDSNSILADMLPANIDPRYCGCYVCANRRISEEDYCLY